jgi:glucosamine--fructose-6-phosphate aminotransferase (isomerizing)
VTGSDVLLAEIREQPAVLDRLRGEQGAAVAELGRRLAAEPPRVVRMAGHGTSDNAATFAVYAGALIANWTAMRDSISLAVYHGLERDARGDLAIGLSQSGETPDVVRWLQAMRTGGALTVAVTNDPGSTLAADADVVLALGAGEERSVAATKTYTAQLAILARLAAHGAGQGRAFDEALGVTAERATGVIAELEPRMAEAAASVAAATSTFVVGRGLEYATAREVALKLTELCQIAAVALTTTDLAHGPVAAVDPGVPVWVSLADDPVLPAALEAVSRVKAAGAPLLAAGPAAASVRDADRVFAVPPAGHAVLGPLLSVLPGQLFARALAEAKGLDPGAPRNLRKVTSAL